LRALIIRGDVGAVKLVGRDVVALREPEQHQRARRGDQRDHD
jgi:hypothetical protein